MMSAALYPKVFDEFESFRQKYGPVDKLSSRAFFVGLENAEEIDVCIYISVLAFIRANMINRGVDVVIQRLGLQ